VAFSFLEPQAYTFKVTQMLIGQVVRILGVPFQVIVFFRLIPYIFQGGWGVDGEAWRWRRRLFVWEEEMLGDLTLLLQNVILQVDKDDRWLWTLESSHVFSVKSAYNALTTQPPIELPVVVCSLWHKDVPLKVVLFAWRMFRDRLPTKNNLHRRMCVSGCGSTETSNHLFLHCNIFGSIWHFINRWSGTSAAAPFYVSDHFNQFSFSGGISKVHCSIIQAIWFATVWEIWKERNNRLFNDNV